MLIVEHRVNWINKGPTKLIEVPPAHGVEIDVRHDPATDKLYLSHDPQDASGLKSCAFLDDYLKFFRHPFIIFNPKETGIEQRIIDLAKKHGINKSQYFLVDVEFPYFYRASREEGVREIAVRFGEAEPIEMALAQKGFVEWVFIDTNTKLPLDEYSAKELAANFKTCLVSPDRWGRAEDIKPYKTKIKKLGFRLDAVMVGKECVNLWEE